MQSTPPSDSASTTIDAGQRTSLSSSSSCDDEKKFREFSDFVKAKGKRLDGECSWEELQRIEAEVEDRYRALPDIVTETRWSGVRLPLNCSRAEEVAFMSHLAFLCASNLLSARHALGKKDEPVRNFANAKGQLLVAFTATAQAEIQRDAMSKAFARQTRDRKEAEGKVHAEASAHEAALRREVEDLKCQHETAFQEAERKSKNCETEIEALRVERTLCKSNERKATEERDAARRDAEVSASQCATARGEAASSKAVAEDLQDKLRRASAALGLDVGISAATTGPYIKPAIKRDHPDPEDRIIRTRPRTGNSETNSNSQAKQETRHSGSGPVRLHWLEAELKLKEPDSACNAIDSLVKARQKSSSIWMSDRPTVDFSDC